MKLLINTSEKYLSVGIMDNCNQIVAVDQNASINSHVEDILSIIQRILSASEFSLKSISQVFIITSPGPRTSIRIGLSVAQCIKLLINAELFKISKFDIAYHSLREWKNYIIVFQENKQYYLISKVKNGVRGVIQRLHRKEVVNVSVNTNMIGQADIINTWLDISMNQFIRYVQNILLY